MTEEVNEAAEAAFGAPMELLRLWFAWWQGADEAPVKMPEALHVRTACLLTTAGMLRINDEGVLELIDGPDGRTAACRCSTEGCCCDAPPLGRSGGVELTEEIIQQAAEEAEAGYDDGQLRPREEPPEYDVLEGHGGTWRVHAKPGTFVEVGPDGEDLGAATLEDAPPTGMEESEGAGQLVGMFSNPADLSVEVKELMTGEVHVVTHLPSGVVGRGGNRDEAVARIVATLALGGEPRTDGPHEPYTWFELEEYTNGAPHGGWHSLPLVGSSMEPHRALAALPQGGKPRRVVRATTTYTVFASKE